MDEETKSKRRQQVVDEIKETESAYLDDLNVIMKVYNPALATTDFLTQGNLIFYAPQETFLTYNLFFFT